MKQQTVSICKYPIQISEIESLASQYSHFPNSNNEPVLSCNRSEKEITINRRLGGAKKCFGRSDDLFVIKDHSGKIIVDSDWSTFSIKGTVLKSTLTTLLEGELRRHLADEGMAMIHASGVRHNGNVLLFPAWRHTGKRTQC